METMEFTEPGAMRSLGNKRDRFTNKQMKKSKTKGNLIDDNGKLRKKQVD